MRKSLRILLSFLFVVSVLSLIFLNTDGWITSYLEIFLFLVIVIGGFALIFLIDREITKRKKAENNLIEYRHFFYNSKDLCIIANKEGYFENANPTFEKVLGYTVEEIMSRPFVDFIHPDDIQKTMEEYERQIAVAKVVHLQNRYRAKNGNYVTLEWNSTPSAETGKIYAIARDITERNKSDEALRKSLREVSDYKFALSNSGIVAITNTKGAITYVNNNFCTISGYLREELIGQDHRIVNSGYHSSEFIRHLWLTIANGKIWRGEIKNKAKDGSYYWVDTTIAPLLNEAGKPEQYLAIRIDITERKKAEEQLLRLNNELEAFTYSVSHDLRAPLRGIVGFTSILEEDYSDKLDKEAKRITNVIKSNAGRMGVLIDDLLAFSRLGRKEIDSGVIHTSVVLSEVIEEHKRHWHGKQINWNINQLPDSWGDLSLLKQVWVNLISNAIKYSQKKDEPHIEVGNYVEHGQLVFYVKDNGVGFDEQYAGKLFKVFQRLHTLEEFEGSGVGLAIVEKIVSRHNGKVWAEGTLNQGACFYFSLPILDHKV